MSIFAELNKQNTEVVAEVTTKDIEKSFIENITTSIFAELDKQNTETTEVVTARDIEKSFKEYAAAEHAANVLGNAAEVISHFAEEGVTAIAADSINIHIDNANSLTGSEITRKFTAEDFSDEATPEARTVIAAQSAEDFTSTAKAAAAKAYEMLRKFIKKIWDWLAGLGARFKKAKKNNEELEKEIRSDKSKESHDNESKEITKPANKYLFVRGKYDPLGALKSLSNNVHEIISHVGTVDVKAIIIKIKREISLEKDAYDTIPELDSFEFSPIATYKTLCYLSGYVTINAGDGGNLLYDDTHRSSYNYGNCKLLSRDEVNKMLHFIANDNSVTLLNDRVGLLNKQLDILADELKLMPGILSTSTGEDLKKARFLDDCLGALQVNLNLTKKILTLSKISDNHLKTIDHIHGLIRWSEANR